MDLVDYLKVLSDRAELAYITLECRLGNPPEVIGLSKAGKISELTINTEKPKQSYFYINYEEVGPGGAVRFKAHPHEVKMLVDSEGNILYTAENLGGE